MTTTCTTEALSSFTGSSLFDWINLEEPTDTELTEADLVVAEEDAAEAAREEWAERQWRHELENGWF